MTNTHQLPKNQNFSEGHYDVPKKTEHDILLLVAEMRKFQKSYFKNRNAQYLARCKQLENEVDRLLFENLGIEIDPLKPSKQCRLF